MSNYSFVIITTVCLCTVCSCVQPLINASDFHTSVGFVRSDWKPLCVFEWAQGRVKCPTHLVVKTFLKTSDIVTFSSSAPWTEYISFWVLLTFLWFVLKTHTHTERTSRRRQMIYTNTKVKISTLYTSSEPRWLLTVLQFEFESFEC